MITGYNTDVKHDGKVFHVQTEDKGVANPIIETLVYVGGGQIIASKQYSYASLIKDGRVEERAVGELLESQHRRILRWITGGKFDPGGPPPFGSTIISDRPFDELVRDFIRAQQGTEPIEIVLGEGLKAAAGTAAAIKILVRSEVSNAPAAGAQITATLNTPGAPPVRVLSAAAGADGTLAGKIKFPVDSAGGTLSIVARLGEHEDSVEIPVETS